MALTRKYTYLTEKVGPESWAGVIVWVCPESQSVALADALHDSVLPGHGGAYPPRAKRVRIHHNAEPDFAWLTARYKTSRQPGEAQLIGRMRSREKKLRVDLDDKVIEGPAGDGIHWWKVEAGTNIVGEGVEAIILRTAVEELDLPGVRKNHGHINANTLVNFGNAPPGSLLFWGFDYNWKFGENLWYQDLEFRVCPEHDEGGTVKSWNDTLYVQKCIWAVSEVPAYTLDAGLSPDQWSATGELVRMKQLVPGYEYKNIDDVQTLQYVAPEPRRSFPEADFSNMDAMVRW